MKKSPLILSSAFLVVLVTSAPAAILLQDNFNDNSLDAAKWDTYIPTGSGITVTPTVTEINQRLEIKGRGYLNTATHIDPDDYVGGITITGTWVFTNSSDFFSVVTRSSGVLVGEFGETSAGAEFRTTTGGVMYVTTRSSGNVSINSAMNSSFTLNLNSIYDFSIADGGGDLSFTLTERSNPSNTGTATAKLGTVNPSYTSNLITFKNREGGSNIAYLDDVVISSVPEVSSSLLVLLSTAALSARRRR